MVDRLTLYSYSFRLRFKSFLLFVAVVVNLVIDLVILIPQRRSSGYVRRNITWQQHQLAFSKTVETLLTWFTQKKNKAALCAWKRVVSCEALMRYQSSWLLLGLLKYPQAEPRTYRLGIETTWWFHSYYPQPCVSQIPISWFYYLIVGWTCEQSLALLPVSHYNNSPTRNCAFSWTCGNSLMITIRCLPRPLPIPQISGAFGFLGIGCSWSR